MVEETPTTPLMESSFRSVSPPPPKRRRLSGPTRQTSATHSVLTIYSWNVNGINPFVQPRITKFFKPAGAGNKTTETSPASLRAVLRRYSWPELLLLQEVKIHPEDLATQKAVERAVQPVDGDHDDGPAYVVRFCLPSDQYNARSFGRRVYGVCTLVRHDFHELHVDLIREVDWDAEGRFLVCETKSEGLCHKLAIINVYAVNGTEAPYRDSKTGEVKGTRHDRKLHVHRRLQEECQALQARGFAIILAGDLNVARSPLDGYPNLRTVPAQHCINRADFESRFFKHPHDEPEQSSGENSEDKECPLGMVDTFRELYPERAGYTYYPRTPKFGASCDRVDMILVSRSLRSQLTAAGMHATPTDRGPSDHVPLYASLDLRPAPS